MKIEEVKQYIKDNGLNLKNRNAFIVDQRAYLYEYLNKDLLFHPNEIALLFNNDRTTILWGLNKFKNLKYDRIFIKNTIELIDMFPIKKHAEKALRIHYSREKLFFDLLTLTEKQYLKILRYKIDNGFKNIDESIVDLINKIQH